MTFNLYLKASQGYRYNCNHHYVFCYCFLDYLLGSFSRFHSFFCTVLGVVGHDTLRKTIATIVFLYFACILPAIALGVLNYNNTKGYIGWKNKLRA